MELKDIDNLIDAEEKKKLEIDMEIKALIKVRKLLEKETSDKNLHQE